jgi:CheY-like chemotaxis protein
VGESDGIPEPSLRVLVVDDDLDTCEMLRDLVVALGHRPEIASTPTDALDQFERDPPDLVFLDLHMPGMNGFDVAAMMRMRGRSTIRIVAVTGATTNEERERARTTGFDAFLLKPVAAADIQAQLAAATA